MKQASCIFFVFFFAAVSFSQTDRERTEWAASILNEFQAATGEQKARITKLDLGPLWTRSHDNDSVLGFIGSNYQRLRIVILSATKVPGRPDNYYVTGKSKVHNVVRGFTGTMKIAKIGLTPPSVLDEEYKSEEIREAGVVVGEYHFSEDPKQTNTGSFDGLFATFWNIDREGRLQYDEVTLGADAYVNGQFAGTWTSFRTKSKKPASWGDSRIPLSGDLDIGDGEFSPNSKYLRFGWQSYRDAYFKQNKRALMEENRQWWK